MKTLSRRAIQMMAGNNVNISGGSSSSSGGGGGGGGGGTADYATNAGHADTADEATHATNADNATNAAYATQAGLASVASNLSANSSDWYKIARKDIAQTIAEVWTFAKGIISTLKSYFNGGIEVTGGTKTDTLQTTGNATVGGTLGVTGKLNGHEADFTDVTMDNLGTSADRVTKIYATDIDAKNIATENLEVTKEAHFFRLVVDELLSNKGAIIISSANCVIEKVNTSSSYYEVLFAMKDADGNNVANSWRVGDQALCLTFKGEGAGTFSNVKNRYYWRYVAWVGSVTDGGVAYHAIRLSLTSGQYDGTDVPAAGDNLVQLGYTGSETMYNYRQSAIIISSYPTMDSGVTPPSIAFYKGINNFNLTSHRYTYIDGLNNEFIGNFKIFVNGSATDITTFFATASGLQAEVINRTNADQAMANGMSRLQMAWNKIALSVFSLVNLANKSTFTQTDTTTEWASDSDGTSLVADETFSSYKPTEMVISFDYSYTTYPWRGNQVIVVYGFINGSSSRSFEVSVNIDSDASATVTVVTGGSNIDAEVSTKDKTGHVNVYVRNSGAVISSAQVRISPRWGVITISNIIVADTDESHAFRRTGIDVIDGLIDLRADRVIFSNSDGTVSGKISIDPTTGALNAVDGTFSGTLRATLFEYKIQMNGTSGNDTILATTDEFVLGETTGIYSVNLPCARTVQGKKITIIKAYSATTLKLFAKALDGTTNCPIAFYGNTTQISNPDKGYPLSRRTVLWSDPDLCALDQTTLATGFGWRLIEQDKYS